MTEHKYIAVDLMDFWQKLSEIPTDHILRVYQLKSCTTWVGAMTRTGTDILSRIFQPV
jgi:hypothetical protein